MTPSPKHDASRSTGLRKVWILVGSIFVGTFLVSAIPAAAQAGVANSASGYYTVYGHEYQNQAIVVTSTSGGGSAQGETYNYWQTGSNPTGWAGARGRLFTSGGTLKCQSSIDYNDEPGYVAVGGCIIYAHGTYYSYGVAYGWNGSGYSPFYTYQSPNQNS